MRAGASRSEYEKMMELENGTTINQYKIISSIGKGAMGKVCLAV